MKKAVVLSVSLSERHTLQKRRMERIQLLKGLGVEGDAHMGKTVKHRSRVAKDPTQPNLRQVHLIHHELHEELQSKGFPVEAGEMGENITTRGIDLLKLPKDTILEIGPHARIQLTGLRNPCHQLETIHKGLMKAVLGRDEKENLIRKAGVMGIVLEGGVIEAGDAIEIKLPPRPHLPMDKV